MHRKYMTQAQLVVVPYLVLEMLSCAIVGVLASIESVDLGAQHDRHPAGTDGVLRLLGCLDNLEPTTVV